mgnify:FL=1
MTRVSSAGSGWLVRETMPEWMPEAILLLTALVTLVNWTAIWRENITAYYVTKPLVLHGLILYFLTQVPLTPARLPFLIGLIFSLIGDVLLIPRGTRWFIAGMSAFSLAQLSYIWGFNISLPSMPVLFVGVLALMAGVLVLHLAIDRFAAVSEIKRSLLPFFKGYGVLVLAMAISAVLCLARPGWSELAAVFAGIGGILFFVSDAMIGLDKLDRRLPKYKFWIIFTYHLGQFLIVASITRIIA